MRRWGAPLVVVVVLALAFAACGEEETHYNDDTIVERLDLEKTGGEYAVDGDPFCEVDGKLLNDATEVEDAAGKDKLGLVISSREGNVAVEAIPPFAPDCGEKVKKKLNKLDPVPKEDK